MNLGVECSPLTCIWPRHLPMLFLLNLYRFVPADHQSIYIGVPVPRGYRRKRRRRHSSISSHDITDIERGAHRNHQHLERYESEDTDRYDLEQTEHSLHPPEVSRTSECPLAKYFRIIFCLVLYNTFCLVSFFFLWKKWKQLFIKLKGDNRSLTLGAQMDPKLKESVVITKVYVFHSRYWRRTAFPWCFKGTFNKNSVIPLWASIGPVWLHYF